MRPALAELGADYAREEFGADDTLLLQPTRILRCERTRHPVQT